MNGYPWIRQTPEHIQAWINVRGELMITRSPWQLSGLDSDEAKIIQHVKLVDGDNQERYVPVNAKGYYLVEHITACQTCRSWAELEKNFHSTLYAEAFAPGASISPEYALAQINDFLPPERQLVIAPSYRIKKPTYQFQLATES